MDNKKKYTRSQKRRKVDDENTNENNSENEDEDNEEDDKNNEEDNENKEGEEEDNEEKDTESSDESVEETEDKENDNQVVYIYSPEYALICITLPVHHERATVVHALLEAYGFMDKVKIVPPIPATDEQLTSFHSEEYISQVKELSKKLPTTRESKEGLQQREGFGLAYDCPPFPTMYSYVQMVAGATLLGARLLCERECTIAVNTEGGRHHGKKDQASGYCYVNDIVIGILALLETFERVLYIDIDIHHGDGVEEAFYLTKKVVTLSFHKQCPGFFPGTGKSTSIGSGRGKNYTINVPLPDEIDDNTYLRIFREITTDLQARFNATAIVMQCGCDTIKGDPLGEWNLTPKVVGECVRCIVDWGLPTLFLGGGGYSITTTARVWAYIMDAITSHKIETPKFNGAEAEPPTTNVEETEEDSSPPARVTRSDSKENTIFTLSEDIPTHNYFMLYGPDFRLPIYSAYRIKIWEEKEILELMAPAKHTISCIPVHK